MAKVIVKTPEGTKKVALYDYRPYWLFDRETIEDGTSERFFFQSPEGKTVVDTNLKQFSTIQVGWKFEVHAIRVVPSTNISIDDAEALFANSALSLYREGDIEVFTAPTMLFPAGAGLYGQTTKTDKDIIALGNPTPQSVLRLPVPIVIKGGETFNIRVVWNPAVSLTAPVKLYVVLDGILKRPVKGT